MSCTRSTPPRTWSRVCATGGQTHKVRCWLKCRSVIYMHHRPAYRTCSSVCVCVVNIVCMFVCSFTVTASRRVAHSHFFLSTAKIYSKSIYSLLSLAGFDYNTFPLRSLAGIYYCSSSLLQDSTQLAAVAYYLDGHAQMFLLSHSLDLCVMLLSGTHIPSMLQSSRWIFSCSLKEALF